MPLRRRIAAVASGIALLVAPPACGAAEDAPPSRSAGDDLPPCADIWGLGGDLPPDYDGCAEGNGTVAANFRTCSSGQRFGFASYRGELYARAGGTIVDVEGLPALRADCTGGTGE